MAHTPNTQRNIDTHRHMHTQTHTDRYRYQFVHFTLFGLFGIHAKDTNFIFGIPQTYTSTQTCSHMDTHMYRDIDTQIQIHRDICMFVYKYTHTHTHTDVHVGNLRKLLLQIHF